MVLVGWYRNDLWDSSGEIDLAAIQVIDGHLVQDEERYREYRRRISSTGLQRSELLNFLLNAGPHGLTLIDVHEPQTLSYFPPTAATHPQFPGVPAILPGMQAGESKNTRPWCFTLLEG